MIIANSVWDEYDEENRAFVLSITDHDILMAAATITHPCIAKPHPKEASFRYDNIKERIALTATHSHVIEEISLKTNSIYLCY